MVVVDCVEDGVSSHAFARSSAQKRRHSGLSSAISAAWSYVMSLGMSMAILPSERVWNCRLSANFTSLSPFIRRMWPIHFSLRSLIARTRLKDVLRALCSAWASFPVNLLRQLASCRDAGCYVAPMCHLRGRSPSNALGSVCCYRPRPPPRPECCAPRTLFSTCTFLCGILIRVC